MSSRVRCTADGAVLVEGEAWRDGYVVWHGKGVSLFKSKKSYIKSDNPPLITFVFRTLTTMARGQDSRSCSPPTTSTADPVGDRRRRRSACHTSLRLRVSRAAAGERRRGKSNPVSNDKRVLQFASVGRSGASGEKIVARVWFSVRVPAEQAEVWVRTGTKLGLNEDEPPTAPPPTVELKQTPGSGGAIEIPSSPLSSVVGATFGGPPSTGDAGPSRGSRRHSRRLSVASAMWLDLQARTDASSASSPTASPWGARSPRSLSSAGGTFGFGGADASSTPLLGPSAATTPVTPHRFSSTVFFFGSPSAKSEKRAIVEEGAGGVSCGLRVPSSVTALTANPSVPGLAIRHPCGRSHGCLPLMACECCRGEPHYDEDGGRKHVTLRDDLEDILDPQAQQWTHTRVYAGELCYMHMLPPRIVEDIGQEDLKPGSERLLRWSGLSSQFVGRFGIPTSCLLMRLVENAIGYSVMLERSGGHDSAERSGRGAAPHGGAVAVCSCTFHPSYRRSRRRGPTCTPDGVLRVFGGVYCCPAHKRHHIAAIQAATQCDCKDDGLDQAVMPLPSGCNTSFQHPWVRFSSKPFYDHTFTLCFFHTYRAFMSPEALFFFVSLFIMTDAGVPKHRASQEATEENDEDADDTTRMSKSSRLLQEHLRSPAMLTSIAESLVFMLASWLAGGGEAQSKETGAQRGGGYFRDFAVLSPFLDAFIDTVQRIEQEKLYRSLLNVGRSAGTGSGGGPQQKTASAVPDTPSSPKGVSAEPGSVWADAHDATTLQYTPAATQTHGIPLSHKLGMVRDKAQQTLTASLQSLLEPFGQVSSQPTDPSGLRPSAVSSEGKQARGRADRGSVGGRGKPKATIGFGSPQQIRAHLCSSDQARLHAGLPPLELPPATAVAVAMTLHDHTLMSRILPIEFSELNWKRFVELTTQDAQETPGTAPATPLGKHVTQYVQRLYRQLAPQAAAAGIVPSRWFDQAGVLHSEHKQDGSGLQSPPHRHALTQSGEDVIDVSCNSPVFTHPHAPVLRYMISLFNWRCLWVAAAVLLSAYEPETGGGASSAAFRRPAGVGAVPRLKVPQLPVSKHAHKRRVRYLRFFIEVAVALADLRNYYGVFAVINGLGMNCVYRLKAAWGERAGGQGGDGIGARHAAMLRHLREGIFSPRKNFREYRRAFASNLRHGRAQVPHLPVLLKDIFQLDELPTVVCEGDFNQLGYVRCQYQDALGAFGADEVDHCFTCHRPQSRCRCARAPELSAEQKLVPQQRKRRKRTPQGPVRGYWPGVEEGPRCAPERLGTALKQRWYAASVTGTSRPGGASEPDMSGERSDSHDPSSPTTPQPVEGSSESACGASIVLTETCFHDAHTSSSRRTLGLEYLLLGAVTHYVTALAPQLGSNRGEAKQNAKQSPNRAHSTTSQQLPWSPARCSPDDACYHCQLVTLSAGEALMRSLLSQLNLTPAEGTASDPQDSHGALRRALGSGPQRLVGADRVRVDLPVTRDSKVVREAMRWVTVAAHGCFKQPAWTPAAAQAKDKTTAGARPKSKASTKKRGSGGAPFPDGWEPSTACGQLHCHFSHAHVRCFVRRRPDPELKKDSGSGGQRVEGEVGREISRLYPQVLGQCVMCTLMLLCDRRVGFLWHVGRERCELVWVKGGKHAPDTPAFYTPSTSPEQEAGSALVVSPEDGVVCPVLPIRGLPALNINWRKFTRQLGMVEDWVACQENAYALLEEPGAWAFIQAGYRIIAHQDDLYDISRALVAKSQ